MPIEMAPAPKRVRWQGSEGRRRHALELEQRLADLLRRAGEFAEPPPWTAAPGGNLAGLETHLDLVTETVLTAVRDRGSELTNAALLRCCELTADLARLRQEHRDHVVGERLVALTSIQETLGQAANGVGVARLLERSAAEAARICALDRVMIYRLVGSAMFPEVTHFVGHDAWAAEVLEHAQPVRLSAARYELEMIRRRVAALITDPREDPRAWGPTLSELETIGFVSAPIVAGGEVIATIHGDTHFSGRRVDVVDRDSIAAFAKGLGFVLERAILAERLQAQRDAVRRLVHATEQTIEQLGAAGFWTGSAPPDGHDGAAQPVAEDRPPGGPELTRREAQVLSLMAAGATNRAIAERLVITEETVKSHVKQVLRKLGVANRSQAVSRYLGSGPEAARH